MSQPDFAYIDPGSGSMILQLILGGLAAAAVFLKMFWHRLLVFLHIREPYQARSGEPVVGGSSQVEHDRFEEAREPAGKR